MNNVLTEDNGTVALGFSKLSGVPVLLSLKAEEANIIHTDKSNFNNSLAIRIGKEWINNNDGLQYKSPAITSGTGENGKINVSVPVIIGTLKIDDLYEIEDNLIKRSVTLENTGNKEMQVTGLRLILPGLRVESKEDCFFEAPGTAVKPHLPFVKAAAIKNSNYPKDNSYPAAEDRYGFSMEQAPDCSPGLLAVYNQRRGYGVLCWYYSESENARPVVKGKGDVLDFIHEAGLAGWLKPGGQLKSGAQYIMLKTGSWEELLKDFQDKYRITGVTPPIYRKAPVWAERANIYEVHPGQFGGFKGLANYLPELVNIGINTLYLMPIWLYDNPSGDVWDENWKRNGSPYAILDYEKLDPGLGTKEDFKVLIEKAHSLGVRVLLDFVAQGCAKGSWYINEHPGWFCRDEGGNLVSSHGWNDTYSFDWANADFHNYMIRWSVKMLKRFGFDGYRVDAPLGKEPNWSRKISYHASRTNLGIVTLLEKLQVEIKKAKSEAVLMCELFGPVFTKSHDLACDYLPSAQTFQMLNQRITPSDWGEWMTDYRLSLPANALRVCFTETHDTRSFKPPSYGLRGSNLEKAGFAALVLAGFIPMIWSGQEKGNEAFYKAMFGTRAKFSIMTGGKAYFNVVGSSNEWVVNILRIFDNQILWGLISLWPEKTTHTFSFPLSMCGIDRGTEYYLYDILEEKRFSEYGKEKWSGFKFNSIELTPVPFKPYFFMIKRDDR